MLGSILNILLVLGSCFVTSGAESGFNETVASSMSSLMAVAITSLIIPATLHASLERSDADSDGDVLVLSHGTAIIMLIVYCVYLFYQLKAKCRLSDTGTQPEIGDEDEKDPRTLGPVAATVCLVTTIVLIAVCAKYLVDGIDGIAETAHISKTFIGIVLLPILGHSAKHVTACVAAYKDKMDLAVSVPIGSAIQVVLFITPFLVVLGWIIGQPMTLHFQSFETVVLFLSVLVVNSIIQGGKSNSLQGCMCLGTYTTIALAFYVYPDDTGSVGSLVKPVFSE
jgi:Ca2+:H+ antiporter